MGKRGGGKTRIRQIEQNPQDSVLQWLVDTPTGFILATAAVGAIAAAVSVFFQKSVSDAKSPSTMYIIVAVALVFLLSFSWLQRPNSRHKHAVCLRISPETYTGIIKRYSKKHEWGLVDADATVEDPGSRAPAARQDIRFYTEDQQALALEPGDPVIFRVAQDAEAIGWLSAVQLRRDPNRERSLPDPSACTRSGQIDHETPGLSEKKGPALTDPVAPVSSAPAPIEVATGSEVRDDSAWESADLSRQKIVGNVGIDAGAVKKPPRTYMFGRPPTAEEEKARLDELGRDEIRKVVENASKDDLQRLLNARIGMR